MSAIERDILSSKLIEAQPLGPSARKNSDSKPKTGAVQPGHPDSSIPLSRIILSILSRSARQFF